MKTKRLRIQPMAFVLLVWMLLTDRGGIALSTLAAAILHESGHVLAAVAMKIPLRDIRLDFLGARLNVSGRVLSYGEEWLLCAAGPLMSLFSAVAVSPLWKNGGVFVAFSCASLILGLLNLLPIRTFDGGRMLECFLSEHFSVRLTRRIMQGCTFLFLFLLWAGSVYFLIKANDGLSLLCFSMSLFFRFFESEIEGGLF